MARFLHLIARITHRFPWLVVLGCVGLLAVSLVAVRRHLRLDTNVAALFPRESEFYQTTRQALRDFGSFEFILCVLEARGTAGEDTLVQAAPIIAQDLLDRRYFYSVDYRLDPQATRLVERGESEADTFIVNLLTEGDWDRIREATSPSSTAAAMERFARLLAVPMSAPERVRVVGDPLGLHTILQQRLTFASGPARLNLRNGYFLSDDGRMLLLVLKPVVPAPRGSRDKVSLSASEDLKFSRELVNFLEDTRDGLMKRHPDWKNAIRISFVGPHFESERNTRMVRNDFYSTLFASLIAVVGLFYLTFRRFEALYLTGIPLACGVGWTLGLTAATVQHLTLITAAVGALLVGLGVNYGILLYSRFIEEVNRGRLMGDAMEIVLQRTGRGIITGGFTTAIGFLGLIFTSFRGFQELGLIAAIGLICCLGAMLLLMPSLMVLRLRRRSGTPKKRPLLTLGLPQLAAMVLNRPKTAFAAGILITAYLGLVGTRLTFNDDISGFQQPSSSYRRLLERLDQHFETPANQLIAIVDGSSLQEALRNNDRLYRNIQSWNEHAQQKVLSVDSLRTLLPSAETQREAQDRMIGFKRSWPEIQDRILRQAEEQGLKPSALEPFFTRMNQLFATAERRPLLEFATLPSPFLQSIVQRYVAKTAEGRYRILTQIYPPRGQWAYDIPEVFLERLRAGDPVKAPQTIPVKVTGIVLMASQLRRVALRDLAFTCLFVVGALIVILMIHFRSAVDCFLALLPVLLSLLWTLGMWRLIGLNMNFLNIVVIPMILGIGVHSGLHLLERYREMGRRRLGLVIETTGRSLLLSALTTILAFGSLALADFRGLQEMGFLTILGVGSNLLATLIFLPATIRFLERGLNFDDWNPQDLG